MVERSDEVTAVHVESLEVSDSAVWIDWSVASVHWCVVWVVFLFGSLTLQTLCYALLTVICLVGMLEIYTFRISLCFPKLACEITLVSFHIRITASQTNGSQACAEETSDGEAKCCQGSKKIINNVQTQQQRVAKLRNSKMVAIFS